MERWILSIEQDLSKFEEAQEELLKRNIKMRMVLTAQDAIAEVSKRI